jgi:peptidoglycan/xylan/chitin deacetylase (PgdA/CDA1 family)
MPVSRKQVFATLATLSLLLFFILAAVSYAHAGFKLETGLISLNVDDGHEDTVLNSYPILKAHHINATSYVITTAVGRPGFMNLSQIIELQKAGWEIGSHGCLHLHMTTVSSDRAWREFNDSKNWFKTRGINVTSFAFPYGDKNSQLTHMASSLYELTRGTSNDSYFYNAIPSDRFVIGVNLPLKNNQTFSLIDKAIKEKKWIAFYFHRVDASGHVVSTGQNISEIADYIQKKVQAGELKVVTMAGAFEALSHGSDEDGINQEINGGPSSYLNSLFGKAGFLLASRPFSPP